MNSVHISPLTRRTLLRHAGRAAALLWFGARGVHAQRAVQSAASNVEMSADAYRPVRKTPKPGAVPSLTDAQVDAFERQLACPCPCTLDVYTCRTTDVSCEISPAVHRDVQSLVEGGYGADEIMAAMVDAYGDFILMQPRRRGFNLLAWIVPYSAIAAGAIGMTLMLRRWRRDGDPA
jgi:cytochrome c-type biogenesis protein CcmH